MTTNADKYFAKKYAVAGESFLDVSGISQTRGQDKKNPIGFCRFNHAKFSSPLYAALVKLKKQTI
jgi:hypothetical protein